MSKLIADFQRWLNKHGAAINVDGSTGPATRDAVQSVFTNTKAPAVTQADLVQFAERVGITLKQMQAIAKVESNGGGFTDSGRPKILFERHYFWRLTGGAYPVSFWNNSKAGGYDVDSWSKLLNAIGQSPVDAFASCSWGKFQVMGSHAVALGYTSPVDFAFSMVVNEAAHYEALVRFILTNGLADEARRIGTDPAANIPFVERYNGPAFRKNDYHNKLAAAMR